MYLIKSADYLLKDVDAKGTVIFMPSSFGIEDAHHDVILKGAYTKTLKESSERIKYLWNHDVNRVVGVVIESHQNEQGLVVKAAINLEKDVGRNTYADYSMAMQYGKPIEHSVAIHVVKSTGTDPRYISEVKLGEVSYTPFRGSNPHTPLLEMKSEDTQFIEYCYNNGDYSDCRMKHFESLLKAEQSLPQADDLTQLLTLITKKL